MEISTSTIMPCVCTVGEIKLMPSELWALVVGAFLFGIALLSFYTWLLQRTSERKDHE